MQDQSAEALIGTVENGSGFATVSFAPLVPVIETKSGLLGLVPGTLNVRLSQPYTLRPDFIVARTERPDGATHPEDLHCDLCTITTGDHAPIHALIVRPHTHAATKPLVEIMACINLRNSLTLTNGSRVSVVSPRGAPAGYAGYRIPVRANL